NANVKKFWIPRKLELELYGTNDGGHQYWPEADFAQKLFRGTAASSVVELRQAARDLLEAYLLGALLGYEGASADEGRIARWIAAAAVWLGPGLFWTWTGFVLLVLGTGALAARHLVQRRKETVGTRIFQWGTVGAGVAGVALTLAALFDFLELDWGWQLALIL